MNRRKFFSLVGLVGLTPATTCAESRDPTSLRPKNYQVVAIGEKATRTVLGIHNELKAINCGDFLQCSHAITPNSRAWLSGVVAKRNRDRIYILSFLSDIHARLTLADIVAEVAQATGKKLYVEVVLPTPKSEHYRESLRTLIRIRREEHWTVLGSRNVLSFAENESEPGSVYTLYKHAYLGMGEVVMRDLIGAQHRDVVPLTHEELYG